MVYATSMSLHDKLSHFKLSLERYEWQAYTQNISQFIHWAKNNIPPRRSPQREMVEEILTVLRFLPSRYLALQRKEISAVRPGGEEWRTEVSAIKKQLSFLNPPNENQKTTHHHCTKASSPRCKSSSTRVPVRPQSPVQWQHPDQLDYQS